MIRPAILMVAFLSSCTVMQEHSGAVASTTAPVNSSAKKDKAVTAAISKAPIVRSKIQSRPSVLAYGGPSPWVCSPSGFGMRSHCVSKASFDF